jgi:hypothetical protein
MTPEAGFMFARLNALLMFANNSRFKFRRFLLRARRRRLWNIEIESHDAARSSGISSDSRQAGRSGCLLIAALFNRRTYFLTIQQ